MKKITKATIILLTILAIYSCENQPIEFDDFGVTTCYFPYQSPARTIILGNYDDGFNDNDNLHQFEIGVIMTGVYENNVARKVFFEVDTALLSNILNVKYLPATHYSIETASPVIIPKGDTKGRILVKLTDAFFNDPLTVAGFYNSAVAVTCNYAVPLKITGIDGLDSVLVGKALVANPIRTKAADWSIVPKDYTLFGVKYINKFHGNYLRRGADKLINAAVDTVMGTKIYRNQYVEKSEVVKASTVDMNKVTVPSIIRRFNRPDGGTLSLSLQFAANGACTVVNNATNAVIGSGMLKVNGDSWGGKTRDVIYLEYTYTDATRNERHEVKDTMVIRDRGVGFETFVPALKP